MIYEGIEKFILDRKGKILEYHMINTNSILERDNIIGKNWFDLFVEKKDHEHYLKVFYTHYMI